MYAINHVPYIDMAESKTGCCTLIHPDEWDDQILNFDNKLFAKARTRSFMHVPLNMNSVMTRAQAKIDEADARADEWIILSHEATPWHADQYFAVDKEVPGLEMERISGEFMTKVFEGDFKDAGKWYEQLIAHVKAKGAKPLKTYFFYTTCPNCAKTYGKNYVVGFAQVSR